MPVNEYQQPVGEALSGWCVRPWPERATMQGRYCRLEALDGAAHGEDLWEAWQQAEDGRDWTYMPVGPFEDAVAFRQHLNAAAGSSDALHYAVIDPVSHRAIGTLALMRIDPAQGAMEVGYVTFSPALRRSPLSTEAHFLLMKYAFDQLGYRRYEWKCDSLNGPSWRAAERLGFRHEGVFRQAAVYKGRTRDTAWFSIIDAEWPTVRGALERWLAADNFDSQGNQLRNLASLRDGK